MEYCSQIGIVLQTMQVLGLSETIGKLDIVSSVCW